MLHAVAKGHLPDVAGTHGIGAVLAVEDQGLVYQPHRASLAQHAVGGPYIVHGHRFRRLAHSLSGGGVHHHRAAGDKGYHGLVEGGEVFGVQTIVAQERAGYGLEGAVHHIQVGVHDDGPAGCLLLFLAHGLKTQPHLVLIPHVIVVAKQIVVGFHPLQHAEEVGAGPMLALIAKQLYVLMFLRIVFLQCQGAVGRPVVVDVDGEIGVRLPQERINQFPQILGSVVGGQQNGYSGSFHAMRPI